LNDIEATAKIASGSNAPPVDIFLLSAKYGFYKLFTVSTIIPERNITFMKLYVETTFYQRLKYDLDL
jgi:hypothetical protein